VVRISAESTIPATEEVFRQISNSGSEEPLFLPKNIRYLAGGAEAALAQALITWSQQKPYATLQSLLESADQIEGFVRRLPGLAGALCASSATGKDGVNILGGLRQAALCRLEQLQGKQPELGYRGSSAEIVCADHLGRGTPYLLYIANPRGGAQLRPRESFRELAAWILRRSIPEAYRGRVDPEASDAMGAMLFEIFKNTEDHALTNMGGDILSISIRAVKTNHHALKLDDLKRIVGDFPPLARYCRSLMPPQGASQVHLFELSVLDSGPGFASTWTGLPYDALSLEDEETATRACFGRGSVKGESRFGEGLPHVMRLLRRQAGFLRLRTGRLSFFADYSEEARMDDATVLRKHEPADAPPLGAAAGSLLTVLLPMRR